MPLDLIIIQSFFRETGAAVDKNYGTKITQYHSKQTFDNNKGQHIARSSTMNSGYYWGVVKHYEYNGKDYIEI